MANKQFVPVARRPCNLSSRARGIQGAGNLPWRADSRYPIIQHFQAATNGTAYRGRSFRYSASVWGGCQPSRYPNSQRSYGAKV